MIILNEFGTHELEYVLCLRNKNGIPGWYMNGYKIADYLYQFPDNYRFIPIASYDEENDWPSPIAMALRT